MIINGKSTCNPVIVSSARDSHPCGRGLVFLRAAAAARVTQHLLVHGLLRSPLLRVLLHQLGELRVDRL